MAKLDSGAMTIGNNDNWREIFDDQNATAQAANQATADLAPIINGKRCALSVASGGYVLLRNSTITGKADGAYTAAKAIPANTDLDGSYLTAVSGGVANALNGNMSYFSRNDGTLRRLDAVDLNTVKRTGNYYANNNCTNSISSGGYLQVHGYDNSHVKQFIQAPNEEDYFTRACVNGTWSAWTNILGNIFTYKKSTTGQSGSVTFTPLYGVVGTRYTALLFVTQNTGTTSIYGVGVKMGSGSGQTTKIFGDDATVNLDKTTGVITVSMTTWSKATLIADMQFT